MCPVGPISASSASDHRIRIFDELRRPESLRAAADFDVLETRLEEDVMGDQHRTTSMEVTGRGSKSIPSA